MFYPHHADKLAVLHGAASFSVINTSIVVVRQCGCDLVRQATAQAPLSVTVSVHHIDLQRSGSRPCFRIIAPRTRRTTIEKGKRPHVP